MLSILAPFHHDTWFPGPIDVTIVHDLMMLVLSCHTHVLCPSIIRIALRLLLSSVAMFCVWAMCHRYFLLALPLIVYRTCQADGDPIQ
jgi:hypothetical protein